MIAVMETIKLRNTSKKKNIFKKMMENKTKIAFFFNFYYFPELFQKKRLTLTFYGREPSDDWSGMFNQNRGYPRVQYIFIVKFMK